MVVLRPIFTSLLALSGRTLYFLPFPVVMVCSACLEPKDGKNRTLMSIAVIPFTQNSRVLYARSGGNYPPTASRCGSLVLRPLPPRFGARPSSCVVCLCCTKVALGARCWRTL